MIENMSTEIERLKQKLLAANLPYELRAKSERFIARLSSLEKMGGYQLRDFELIENYVDWIVRIPFSEITNDNQDFAQVNTILDQNHYGLSEVKEILSEYIAAQKYKNKVTDSSNLTEIPNSLNKTVVSQPSLCFIGVQGVGKTTMARSMAMALGRNFQRIALGAVADVRELRGTMKTESGSEPGQIIKSLIRSGSMNPVILLDEIDKVSDSNSARADVMASLLEILDPEQNKSFRDRYLDHPVDLSRVLFIATANNVGGMSAALLDRLELIRFSSYTDEEKIKIAKSYVLPKLRDSIGIQPEQLDFSEEVWPLIVRPYGMDPGIRQLERNLLKLIRKVAKLVLSGMRQQIVITPDNYREFLPERIELYT